MCGEAIDMGAHVPPKHARSDAPTTILDPFVPDIELGLIDTQSDDERTMYSFEVG